MRCHGKIIARREAAVRQGPLPLGLRARRGNELGYSEIEVAELLAYPGRLLWWWTAYVIMAGKCSQAILPADRRLRSDISPTTRRKHGGRSSTKKSPEEAAIASPLWTRRAVAEWIRRRTGSHGADRRGLPRAAGLHRKVRRRHGKDQDPEEVRIGWRSLSDIKRGPPGGCEIHRCDETGAVAAANATALRPGVAARI